MDARHLWSPSVQSKKHLHFCRRKVHHPRLICSCEHQWAKLRKIHLKLAEMALSISFWRQQVVQKSNRDKTKIRAKLKTSPAKIRARLALKTCWLVQTTKKSIYRTATVLSVSGDCLKRLMSKILHYQAWLIIPMFKRLAISIKFLPISQIVRVQMTTVGQLLCLNLKRSHTSSILSPILIWRMSSCQRRHKRLHCLSLISIYS